MSDDARCCAITGASGYVGSKIAGYIRPRGWRIVELIRAAQPLDAEDRVVRYELGDEIAPEAFRGVDVLVHCAYDFEAYGWDAIRRANVDGSLRLFAAAHAGGVRTIVFISTISAFPGCRSLYGQAKLAVEQGGEQYGIVSVRPGLVYDDDAPRGMVGALSALITRSPVIPLIGGGQQVLYPCHAEDLARLVFHLASTRPTTDGPITAASPSGITFREILACLAAARGKRVVFVPVPYALVLGGLRVAERSGARTRLRSDSLVSLANQSPRVDFASLAATSIAFRDYAVGQGGSSATRREPVGGRRPKPSRARAKDKTA